MTWDDDLPHELWREVLTKVPVKSILRFRSVCKSWYSLISCPNFISDYSSKNLNKNGDGVLLRVFDNSWSYNSHSVSFSESRGHDYIPKQFLGSDVEIVGSCNGLVCLSKCDGSVMTFLVWNPTIRKVVELPPRTFRHGTQYLFHVGFGYDSNTNDYKVMMSFGEFRRDGFSYVTENMCEIFYLKKRVWRVISPIMAHRRNLHCPTYRQECYLDGVVHWTGFEPGNSSIRILLSFDMSDECFRVIRLPDFTPDGDGYIETFSTTLGGLIYVMAYKMRSGGDVPLSLSLWVMKEYGVTESWTKVSDIDQQSYFWRPRLHLWENGEVLVVHDYCDDDGCKQDFVLYNIGNKKSKCIFSTASYYEDLCRFKESLVLM